MYRGVWEKIPGKNTLCTKEKTLQFNTNVIITDHEVLLSQGDLPNNRIWFNGYIIFSYLSVCYTIECLRFGIFMNMTLCQIPSSHKHHTFHTSVQQNIWPHQQLQ